jgi:hypothetical protein
MNKQPTLLACDYISYKCKMRTVLLHLHKTRASGQSLGSLGGVHFQPLQVFLSQAIKNAKPNNGIYNSTKPDQHVLAVGDVHGDLLALLSALYLGGVIGEDAKWCGGNTMVVQLGDILDRSGRGTSEDTSKNKREEIDILQYLHGLGIQAHQQKGGVVSVTGNHEADKFVFRDQPMDSFEGGQFHVDGWGGLKTKRALFTPKSDLAKYFAYFKPVIVRVNDFLFCHGGLVSTNGMSIEKMNATWRAFLFGEIPELPKAIMDIYWNRDLSLPSPNDEAANAKCVRTMQKLFSDLNLGQKGGIVVSHTVQQRGIPFYCKGKVWRIDVALSEAFGRRGAPIEVLRICFNSREWSGQTVVQIVKGMQNKSAKTTRSTVEVQSFVGGDLTWVEKTSKVMKNDLIPLKK